MKEKDKIASLMEYFEINNIPPGEAMKQMIILMGRLLMLHDRRREAVEGIRELLLECIDHYEKQEE